MTLYIVPSRNQTKEELVAEIMQAVARQNLHQHLGAAQLELKRVQLAATKFDDKEIIRLAATALALVHQAEDRLYFIERTQRA